MDQVLQAELLAHGTWPCVEESHLGDWILRAASGFSRRANSALAIGSSGTCLDGSLDRLCEWYRARDIEPCIKITPLASPDLDAALDARRWTVATPAHVMRARLPSPEPGKAPAGMTDSVMAIDPAPSEEWLESLFDWNGVDPRARRSHRELFDRMPSPRFASWRSSGRLEAVCTAVVLGSSAHLYDFVVAPDARRRGIGEAFLVELLRILSAGGAQDATLQVLRSNTPAISLYRKTGFVESHPYHYRVGPSVGTVGTSGC